MNNTMPAWLDSLSREGCFIVVGRAGLDLYPSPPGTQITCAKTFSSDIGGSAGNIAVALARAVVLALQWHAEKCAPWLSASVSILSGKIKGACIADLLEASRLV